MRLPFVSRARFEAAEQELRLLNDKIDLLLDAKSKAEELAALEKELRHEAEQKADQVEDASTRPHRIFGSSVRERANSWAAERHQKQGTSK